MPVKALMELAMATIFKNIKELNNAGDFLPYETLFTELVLDVGRE